MKKHRYLFLFVIPLLIPLLVGGTTKWKESRRHQQDLERRQQSLDTELLQAAGKGDIGRIKQLCSQGANPNALHTTTSGRTTLTPLGFAVNKRHTGLIKYLLAQGADINALSGGATPLHYAVISRDVKLLKLLLANGADISVRNSSDETPLEWCIRYQKISHDRPGISPLQKANAREIERLLRAAARNKQ